MEADPNKWVAVDSPPPKPHTTSDDWFRCCQRRFSVQMHPHKVFNAPRCSSPSSPSLWRRCSFMGSCGCERCAKVEVGMWDVEVESGGAISSAPLCRQMGPSNHGRSATTSDCLVALLTSQIAGPIPDSCPSLSSPAAVVKRFRHRLHLHLPLRVELHPVSVNLVVSGVLWPHQCFCLLPQPSPSPSRRACGCGRPPAPTLRRSASPPPAATARPRRAARARCTPPAAAQSSLTCGRYN